MQDEQPRTDRSPSLSSTSSDSSNEQINQIERFDPDLIGMNLERIEAALRFALRNMRESANGLIPTQNSINPQLVEQYKSLTHEHEQLLHGRHYGANHQLRRNNRRQENGDQRPTCCSFCYGTYLNVWKNHRGIVMPTRDEFGPWSTHAAYHNNIHDGIRYVTCPVLRSLVCPRCHATGDNAHTLSNCPF